MRLSATQVKNTKPAKKPYKLPDERGLYLRVMPSGAKYWRYDYRFQGSRNTATYAVYPDVSLAKARERHQEARSLLG